jgi:hypothetical protein
MTARSVGPVSDGCQITAPAAAATRPSRARTTAFRRADGTFSIEDIGAGIRVQIAASGAVTIPGSLSVSGAFNTNAITGTTIIASTYLQTNHAAGGDANIYSTVVGVRQWRSGTRSDGLYIIQDDTAGALRFYITTVGAEQPDLLGKFQHHQISGTTIIASTNMQVKSAHQRLALSPEQRA